MSKIFNDKYTQLFQVNKNINLTNELYYDIKDFYEDFINYINCFRYDSDILLRLQNVIEEYSFDMIYYVRYIKKDLEFIYNLPNEIIYANHKYPNKIYEQHSIFDTFLNFDKYIDPKFIKHMINLGFDVNMKIYNLSNNILLDLWNIKTSLDGDMDLIKLIINLTNNINKCTYKLFRLDFTLDELIEILNTPDKNGNLIQINKADISIILSSNKYISISMIDFLIEQSCNLHNLDQLNNKSYFNIFYYICGNGKVSLLEIIKHLINLGFDPKTYIIEPMSCISRYKNTHNENAKDYFEILKLLGDN